MSCKEKQGYLFVSFVLCMALWASEVCASIHGLLWSPSGRHIAVLTGKQESVADKVTVFSVGSLMQARVTLRMDVAALQTVSWLPPKEQWCYVVRSLYCRKLVVRGFDGKLAGSALLPWGYIDVGIRVSPTGETLALGEFQGNNGSCVRFLTKDLKDIAKWPVEGSILGLQWLPDTNDSVVVQSRILHKKPGQHAMLLLQVIRSKSGPIGKAIPMASPSWCYSPSGAIYFTSSNKKYVDVFKLDTLSGRQARVLDGSKWGLDSFVNASWSPQARILAIVGRSGLVFVNLATGTAKIVWSKAGASQPTFTMDAKRLAFVSGKSIIVMDIKSGKITTIKKV